MVRLVVGRPRGVWLPNWFPQARHATFGLALAAACCFAVSYS